MKKKMRHRSASWKAAFFQRKMLNKIRMLQKCAWSCGRGADGRGIVDSRTATFRPGAGFGACRADGNPSSQTVGSGASAALRRWGRLSPGGGRGAEAVAGRACREEPAGTKKGRKTAPSGWRSSPPLLTLPCVFSTPRTECRRVCSRDWAGSPARTRPRFPREARIPRRRTLRGCRGTCRLKWRTRPRQ